MTSYKFPKKLVFQIVLKKNFQKSYLQLESHINMHNFPEIINTAILKICYKYWRKQFEIDILK